ncbi:hypothetical protein B0H65DRAFT_591207 [Neurospora tetraspora]|uniref:Uncharacterized protein n=1 Tax=Neurospora tetraspora TaxID=94610 RepID=A0AAE0J860_9PEZI|nr:hypothetical protein B0H65DRAFT_591207 [Neurospora tetraspora]
MAVNSYPGEQGNYRHQKKTSSDQSSGGGTTSNAQPQAAGHASLPQNPLRDNGPQAQSPAGYGSQMGYNLESDPSPKEARVAVSGEGRNSRLTLGVWDTAVTFRVGLLASLRSRKLNSQTIGRVLWLPPATTLLSTVVPRSLRDLRGEMLEEEGRRVRGRKNG